MVFNNIVDAWIADAERKESEQNKILKEREAAKLFSNDWLMKVAGNEDQSCSKERFILSCLIEMKVLSMRRDILPLKKVRTFRSNLHADQITSY